MLDKTRSLTQYFQMRDLWTLNFILSFSPFPFCYSLIWFVCAIVYIILLYRTASTTVAVIICMTKALKSFRSRVCQVENDYSASWQTMYTHHIRKSELPGNGNKTQAIGSEACITCPCKQTMHCIHRMRIRDIIVDSRSMGTKNISFMKIMRFVRTNTWSFYVLLYV